MIVDTSALAAVMFREPECERIIAVLESATPKLMSTVNYYELLLVLSNRFGSNMKSTLDKLIEGFQIRIVPFTELDATNAHVAYMIFGKGWHPARLNMADCAAYSLAVSHRMPLLYKGDDFSRTPIRAVEY